MEKVDQIIQDKLDQMHQSVVDDWREVEGVRNKVKFRTFWIWQSNARKREFDEFEFVLVIFCSIFKNFWKVSLNAWLPKLQMENPL